MPLIIIVALGAGALIVVILAIAFVVPNHDPGPTTPNSRMARPQPPVRMGPTPVLRTGSRPRTPPTGNAPARSAHEPPHCTALRRRGSRPCTAPGARLHAFRLA